MHRNLRIVFRFWQDLSLTQGRGYGIINIPKRDNIYIVILTKKQMEFLLLFFGENEVF